MGQKPNELTPDADPWSMLGAEIRMRRTSRGWSLARLSAEVTWDSSYLAKWERAERRPTQQQVADVDQAVAAGGALQRLWALASRWTPAEQSVRVDVANHDMHVANDVATLANDARSRASWTADTVSVPATASDGQELIVQVNRRLFLEGLGATAMFGAPGADSGITSAPVPNNVDPISHFRSVKIQLMNRDNLRGPAVTISDAQRHLLTMDHAVQDSRGIQRRQLIEVQTQMADLAGWLYQDSGHLDGASYWLSKSIENSHLVDSQVTAFLLSRKSQMLAEAGDAHGALDSALAAQKMARSNTRIACVADTFAAHAYALLGDADSSARTYQAAHSALATLAESGPGAAYALFMCPAYVLSYEARSLAYLEEFQTSADRFSTALSQLDPSMHRDRGVYTAWLAQSLTQAGDHETAAQRGMEALAIASGTDSARILQELHRLSELLPAKSTDAAAFRAALTDLERK